ncbi:MAG TPA: DNA translocase FtsK 4TM domain-containing protein, partial [Gemmatimonadaceae bacterium]
MGSSTFRREVAGIALSALALFLAGALATLAWAQLRGGVDVAANVGGVGRFLAEPLVGFLGWAGAWLAPVAAAVAALRAFGLFAHDEGDADRGRAWFVFSAGLALILPVVVALALGVTTASGDAPAAAGLWGSFVAAYWRDWFGGFGAWIGILFVLSVLTAATLAWNPIRVLVGHRAGGAGARSGALAGQRSSAAIEVERALSLEPPPEEMPELQGPPGVMDLEPEPDGDGNGKRRGRKKSKAAVAEERAEERAEEIAAAIESTREPDVLGDELPSPELLTPSNPPAGDTQRRELDAMGLKLMDALRTFKVDGELVGRTTGPTVTQYEIEPAPGVKVRQFANLANDLALAMRAQSIRVVAPIPGRGAVGVEVPNPTPEMVRFRELVEAAEFSARGKFALPIGLGKDLEGRPVIADLAKMPHLLIAGATGSGKSVCVNTIITSLVYRHTPRTLRFLMVDPKMVELSVYNTLPHLRHKVITDNRDAAAVLKWAVLEMQERYELLAANGCRNLQDFNRRAQDGAELKLPKRPDVAFEDTVYRGGILPYIVVVIDEMADLMMTVQGEVETPIAMLAQKARAIGIHLILATQRPSVNVITGLIKANFPSRIAFRVASQVDSRTI